MLCVIKIQLYLVSTMWKKRRENRLIKESENRERAFAITQWQKLFSAIYLSLRLKSFKLLEYSVGISRNSTGEIPVVILYILLKYDWLL